MVTTRMRGSRVTLAVIFSVAVAACSTTAGPTPSPADVPSAIPSAATVVDRPTPVESTAPPSTPTPTAAPTPSPTATPTVVPITRPTQLPVPPKPSGIDFSYCCGLGGDGVSTVFWQKPRTKGVEVRAYGVTACLPGDLSDETCLRERTTLPEGVGVLLAKGPASAGSLSWQQGEGDGEGCVAEYLTEKGSPFYSVVVAAYNASGHSVFAIADEGYVDSEACAPYVIQPGDTLSRIAAHFDLTRDDLVAANRSTLSDPDKLPVGGTILIPQPTL